MSRTTLNRTSRHRTENNSSFGHSVRDYHWKAPQRLRLVAHVEHTLAHHCAGIATKFYADGYPCSHLAASSRILAGQ